MFSGKSFAELILKVFRELYETTLLAYGVERDGSVLYIHGQGR